MDFVAVSVLILVNGGSIRGADMQVNEINGGVIVCPLMVQAVHQLCSNTKVPIGFLDSDTDEMPTNDAILELVENDSPNGVTNGEILRILGHEIEIWKSRELVTIETKFIILWKIPLVTAHDRQNIMMIGQPDLAPICCE